MTGPLRDIREFLGDADAYRDELFRRWTGLLSYRYIGRNHSSMNVGDSDDTVAIRREPQDKLFHVQIGPFATKKEADAMRQHLQTDGYNSAIVK